MPRLRWGAFGLARSWGAVVVSTRLTECFNLGEQLSGFVLEAVEVGVCWVRDSLSGSRPFGKIVSFESVSPLHHLVKGEMVISIRLTKLTIFCTDDWSEWGFLTVWSQGVRGSASGWIGVVWCRCAGWQ